MKKFKFDKQLWMKIHVYLSIFFFPAAFIYVLTGALYIFEVRENADATIHTITLDSLPEKGQEQEFILNLLAKHNLKIPSDTQVRMMKGMPTMGNIKYSASIAKDRDGTNILRTTDRGLYGILLLMHKAKGKFYFDIIAVTFSISMIIFYLSGLIMTSFCKKRRKSALWTFVAGLGITALAVYLSI
ncbi:MULTISPECIES: PepSY-associated TM helix domain-containing protein [unclassified Helicobacter]|uniref:PepSY-associated TM helix domain-containing protein n=1 Tax=unclassified Helicobacter TaxID=2593540 RepID=UPI0021619DED|nr:MULTISPECIES: PepSY-associated TM helix domain-containing protein [unclassified Helicobacter]